MTKLAMFVTTIILSGADPLAKLKELGDATKSVDG